MPSPASVLRHAAVLTVVLLGVSALLTAGLRWGLPSQARARFYYDDPARMAQEYPHSVALHSYHPDEPHIFMALNNMRPEKLDFNPRYFVYPTLYIYAVGVALRAGSAFGLVTLTRSKEFYFRYPDEMGNLYAVARATTVAFAILTVVACYALGRSAFGRRAGLLAAVFLGVSPLFVVHSHYATVDVPVTFWMTASLWATVRALDSRRTAWYALAGLTAGLAAATKYYGGVVILPLLMRDLLRGEPRTGWRPVLAVVGLVPVGFLLGCPYAALAPRDFVEYGVNVLLDAQAIGVESYDLVYGYFPWPFFYHLYLSLPQGMGLPLLLLALAGTAWALRRRTATDVVLLVFVLAYYVMIGVSFLRPMRYSLPLLPPLAVLASRLAIEAYDRLAGAGRPAAVAVLWGTLVAAAGTFSLLVSVGYVRTMVEPDARDEAAAWLARHVPPGARIGLILPPGFQTPPLAASRYDLRVIGLDRPTLERELPDYLVMSEIEFRDFLRALSKYPQEVALLLELLSGATVGDYRYVPVKFMRHPRLLGLDLKPRLPPHDWLYISPDVYVLKREARS